jgi:hypothetical protein
MSITRTEEDALEVIRLSFEPVIDGFQDLAAQKFTGAEIAEALREIDKRLRENLRKSLEEAE